MADVHAESDAPRQRLNLLHSDLLELHKALLDQERARYEAKNGHVGSAGEMLQLVIQDPQFDWLHALSELIVEIDEFTESDEPLNPATADALMQRVRTLLSPDAISGTFQQNYAKALAESPDVARLHSKWQRSADAAR